MRNNKIIAVLITVSMLFTAITLPVSADDTVFTKIYASDNFAQGTDGWIVGESGEGFLATITTVDDADATDGKALKITFPGKGAKHEKGDKYAPIKTVYYHDELNDEFSIAKITPKKIDENYVYCHDSLFKKFTHFFWYRIIATPPIYYIFVKNKNLLHYCTTEGKKFPAVLFKNLYY